MPPKPSNSIVHTLGPISTLGVRARSGFRSGSAGLRYRWASHQRPKGARHAHVCFEPSTPPGPLGPSLGRRQCSLRPRGDRPARHEPLTCPRPLTPTLQRDFDRLGLSMYWRSRSTSARASVFARYGAGRVTGFTVMCRPNTTGPRGRRLAIMALQSPIAGKLHHVAMQAKRAGPSVLAPYLSPRGGARSGFPRARDRGGVQSCQHVINRGHHPLAVGQAQDRGVAGGVHIVDQAGPGIPRRSLAHLVPQVHLR